MGAHLGFPSENKIQAVKGYLVIDFYMLVLLITTLTLYDLGKGISSVWPKFRFLKKKGSLKKIPMSAASMSR